MLSMSEAESCIVTSNDSIESQLADHVTDLFLQ